MTPSFQKSNVKKKAQSVNFMPSANWILPKKIFNSLKQMDENMLRNEDWDFIYKMRKTKYKLLFSSDVLIYHDNNTIFHFIKKRFIYGFYMWPILTKSVYLVTVLWESVRISKNLITFFFILPILIIGNISPGFGILFGLYNYIKNKDQ